MSGADGGRSRAGLAGVGRGRAAGGRGRLPQAMRCWEGAGRGAVGPGGGACMLPVCVSVLMVGGWSMGVWRGGGAMGFRVGGVWLLGR